MTEFNSRDLYKTGHFERLEFSTGMILYYVNTALNENS